jgi:2-alkyl-3-oxoalkanoate reductase
VGSVAVEFLNPEPRTLNPLMHALVTGGGGFLGRAIVEQLLARGDRVRVFTRGHYPELTQLGVEVVRGDLRNAPAVSDACQGVDCVFHAAALAGISLHWQDYFATNTLGTEAVVAACLGHGIPRLVYTSSPSVVFAGTDQINFNDTFAYNLKWQEKHNCHYSRSKALAELIVMGAKCAVDWQSGQFLGDDLKFCVLRPHLIWGPGDRHLIPRLIARAQSRRLRRIGSGTNLVDITYVDNAASAHLQAADALALDDSPVHGKAYFLSQGEPVNCWQWIDQILALANLPPVRKSISFTAAWNLGAVCEAAYRLVHSRREPPMTRFLAAQLSMSHWFDISAARRDFGFEPRISTAEGMQRLGAWLAESAAAT